MTSYPLSYPISRALSYANAPALLGGAPTSFFHNFTGSNLSIFQTGMAAYLAGTSNVSIGSFGDSTDTGAGAGTSGNSMLVGAKSRNFAAQLAALYTGSSISSAFADGNILSTGVTLPQYDPRFTVGSGWSLGGQVTLGGNPYICTTDGAVLSFTDPKQVDTFLIGYIASGSGICNVNVDGGSTLATLTGTGSTLTFATITVPLGVHTLNFVKSGTVQSSIASIYAYNSAVKEISVKTFGHYAGSSTTLSNTVGSFASLNALGNANITPHLLSTELGIINDWETAVPLATSATNTQKIITAMISKSSILLRTGYPSNPATVPYATQLEYVDQFIAIGRANGLAVFDSYRFTMGWSVAKFSDNEHPNFNQYGLTAAAIFPALQPGFTAP